MSTASADPAPPGQAVSPAAGRLGEIASWRSAIVLGAFGVYWLTAIVLQARGGATHFGADTHLYAQLAEGLAHPRMARFHPLTIALGTVWLQLLHPLTAWMTPLTLLKGLFAAVGALGVWAAMAAFAAVVPRRHVALLGVIYATSLSIWYFASVEESKIVSATLTALYIAAYLRLRQSWTVKGALLLTGILLLACLNEIVAGFLVVIPAVDALVQRGWRLRGHWWIGWHALAAPLALVFLEVAVNGRLVAGAPDNPEAASHVSMLLYYVTQTKHDWPTFVNFVSRWLFYSIAAPSMDATYAVRTNYAGDFGPDVTLASYLASPVSAALVLSLGTILLACVPRGDRGAAPDALRGVMLALAAYALVRGIFFFVVYPYECLIFSSCTVLAHLMLVAIPFGASSFPHRQWLLATSAALLFIANGSFMIGQ
jgi:hypothetical protein